MKLSEIPKGAVTRLHITKTQGCGFATCLYNGDIRDDADELNRIIEWYKSKNISDVVVIDATKFENIGYALEAKEAIEAHILKRFEKLANKIVDELRDKL